MIDALSRKQALQVIADILKAKLLVEKGGQVLPAKSIQDCQFIASLLTAPPPVSSLNGDRVGTALNHWEFMRSKGQLMSLQNLTLCRDDFRDHDRSPD